MHLSPRSRQRQDHGMTLIELVIAVAIVGIIVVALTGVLIEFFKVNKDTSSRLAESHDVQFASAYWQRDVASVGIRSSTYCQYATDPGCSADHSFPMLQSVAANGNTGVTPGCTMPAGTTNVVTLGWSNYTTSSPTDPPSTVTVSYRIKASGAGTALRYSLIRVRCNGSTQYTVTNLANNLTGAPTVSCPGNCNGSGSAVPNIVTMTMTTNDPKNGAAKSYTATLTGERRDT